MIRRFEPRAKVTDVTPALDEAGNLVLEVEINLD
nr:MAG TPA: Regulator of RpoS, Anti-adapter protein regulator, ClpXP adaptor, anti-adaptor.0A [Caudoviricetes sp.]